MEPERGFKDLDEEVIKAGLCTGCGACVASCQYNVLSIPDREPKLVGDCPPPPVIWGDSLSSGRCAFCYHMCPQTGDPEKLEMRVFGQVPRDPELGIYRDALSLRTVDEEIRKRCQDGGAVTSILASLLERDFIDGAVVMGSGGFWKPKPKVALTREDIIGCAGTKYTLGPTLLGLREAVDLFLKERVAVVGTPCQIKALRRMQFDDVAFRHLGDRLALTIGLFCMESFDYDRFKKFVEEKLNIPLKDVSKFDIKKGIFIAYSEGMKKEVEVKNLHECVSDPCLVCKDFSCELADISVGAVGSPEGRSTVLVRSKVGGEAIEVARSDQKLDVKPLESFKPGIDLVKRISKRKKDSAEKELKLRREVGKPLPPWMKRGGKE